jgi:hypothetical protein
MKPWIDHAASCWNYNCIFFSKEEEIKPTLRLCSAGTDRGSFPHVNSCYYVYMAVHILCRPKSICTVFGWKWEFCCSVFLFEKLWNITLQEEDQNRESITT